MQGKIGTTVQALLIVEKAFIIVKSACFNVRTFRILAFAYLTLYINNGRIIRVYV